MDQTTPAHRLPRAVRHPHQRGHADRVRAHTSAVPAEPGQSKFRSARTRPLVHRADIHAVRAESGPSAHRRSAHAGCVRPGRIGDRQNQNRMGVRHHHTGWRGLGHGTVLPIRRAQPPMACDLAWWRHPWSADSRRRHPYVRQRVHNHAVAPPYPRDRLCGRAHHVPLPRRGERLLPACHFGDWPRARLSDGLLHAW